MSEQLTPLHHSIVKFLREVGGKRSLASLLLKFGDGDIPLVETCLDDLVTRGFLKKEPQTITHEYSAVVVPSGDTNDNTAEPPKKKARFDVGLQARAAYVGFDDPVRQTITSVSWNTRERIRDAFMTAQHNLLVLFTDPKERKVQHIFNDLSRELVRISERFVHN